MTKVTFHKLDMDGNRYTVEGIARLAFAIKATMKFRGWSERKLASHAGISHVTINKYVRANIHEPQADILKAIAPLIYKVSAIDTENIEIYSDETYGEDWQSLEKLATVKYTEVMVADSDSKFKANASPANSTSNKSAMKVEETPTKYKPKSKK